MSDLDTYDMKILDALRVNGRLSNVEVADMVGLSHSSCSRRISRLEKSGVICGYRALTNRTKIGLTVRAYCGVIRDPKTKWDELARELVNIEGVVSIMAVSGDTDIMLEIIAKDMQHYSDVILQDISSIKGISGTHSSFVLKEVKSIF